MELELGGTDAADSHSIEARVETSRPQLVNNEASAGTGAQISRLPTAAERSLQEQVAKLEERVALLESSNGMMFNLIRKVLRILRGGQDYSSVSTVGK
jgi:hypothetical protein